MSSNEKDTVVNPVPVNVENILADFFLEQFEKNMKSSDDDREYRKKSKHKKHKSKKSKNKHKVRSRSSSYETSQSKHMKDIGNDSSSEEKDIKRLKKIKKLEGRENKYGSIPPTYNSLCKSSENFSLDPRNSPEKIDDVYGPSLDLLLSGIPCNKDEKPEIHSNIPLPKLFGETVPKMAEPVYSKHDEKPLFSENLTSNLNILSEEIYSKLKENTVTDEGSGEGQDENSDKSESKLSSFKEDNISAVTKLKEKSKRKKSRHKRSSSRSTSKSHQRDVSRSKSRSRSPSPDFRTRKHSRSRSRSKSKSRRRDRSRSRSRSRGYSTHSRSRRRTRSRSKSGTRRHSRSRSASRGFRSSDKSYRRKRSYSRERSRSKYYKDSSSRRKRSRHRSRSHSHERSRSRSRRDTSSKREFNDTVENSSKNSKIDQAKILKIAQKNVLSMIEQGTLPDGLSMENFKKDQLLSMKSGGKSVQELTDFCTKLSKRENDPIDDVKSTDDTHQDGGDAGFIHHPFKLKETSMIRLNIKNAVQIPIKTHAEKFAETAKLSSQFPVSSGNQHKRKELEWIPVVPDDKSKSAKNGTENKAVVAVPTDKQNLEVEIPMPNESNVAAATPSTSASVPPPLPPPPEPPLMAPPPLPPLPPPPPMPSELMSTCASMAEPPAITYTMPPSTVCYPEPMISHSSLMAPIGYPQSSGNALNMSHGMINNMQEMASPCMELPPDTQTYSQPIITKPSKPLDIASIVSKRFKALTKLQSDPNDFQALRTIQEAQQNIQEWVQSQQVPGLFTGSTDAKLLTVQELSGPRHWHYRVKRDIFTRAAPVTEGKGMSLLKKMGWNPGEGLGKNKEGSLEPLVLDIKTDKKGLVSEGEGGKKGAAVKELQGKHPVSALMELCSKRKWKSPLYTVVQDSGPPHKKLFLFKVEVNGVEYIPVTPTGNKKIAKSDAAVVCLQSLNVFPKGT